LARSLDVDILIDLSGFTLGNRIQALRVRCAPIQISWLGYCNTLGLECVDYLIADPNLIKKEEEKFYSEKILYLPKIWSAMSKPKDFPDVNILPVKNSSIFTFGSFNNFSKLSDETIKVWSKILNNSNSRLVLKSGSLTSDSTIENIRNKFFKFILEKNKILILNKDINRKDHIEQYNQIDVALDPFPYPGVTTSFESVMMGVPVLTMRGFNFNSRCGESINLNLEMQEFIATNSEDYYLKAIQLQKDPTKLELLRSSLRDKALASPLFDVDNFSENFCNTLKKVWNNHIDG
jgi:protein O-GlcNAc transferase